MKFQIEVINVQSSTKPAKNGTYTQLDVAYKRVDTGKIEGKKVMSFVNKDIFNLFSKASAGQVYDITTEKVGEYWQWTEASVASGSGSASIDAPASKAFNASPAPKSTYETAEERAKRQILIVRQSSLAQAVDILSVNPGKDKLSLEDVLHLADKLVSWVFETAPPPSMDIGDMDNDIPS